MEEKTLSLATVSFLMEGNGVWLGKKARKIGKGCQMGPGGGPEPKDGGNLIKTAMRESLEEFGIQTTPEQFEKVAIIKFHNTKSNGKKFICEVHFYMVRGWCGKPRVTKTKELLDPQLYPLNKLPLGKELMPADREFFPLLMQGNKLIATYYYGPFQKKLIKPGWYKIVDSFPE